MTELQVYIGVMLAGLVSFLSPCVLPLVPPYLSFLGGDSVALMMETGGELDARARRRVIVSALAFVAGFSTVFMALGAGASALGQLLLAWKTQLSFIAGFVIVAFGLHFLGLIHIPMLHRDTRYHTKERPVSYAGAYLVGLAFAFGWTPCVGPVLSAVLSVAGNSASLGRGVGLLFLYSLGLGVPFLLAAVAIGPFLNFFKVFRRHLTMVERVMGAALIVAGLMISFGWLNSFGSWLLDQYPGIANVEAWVVPESIRGAILRRGG